MRAFTTFLFATTTLLSGLAATAAAADLPAPQPTLQQMQDIQGSYALSNGQRARIVIMDGRLYLDAGRQYRELEPAGPDRWATRDHTLSLRFQPDQAGDRIVMDVRSDLPDAAPIRLASNERRGRGGSGN